MCPLEAAPAPPVKARTLLGLPVAGGAVVLTLIVLLILSLLGALFFVMYRQQKLKKQLSSQPTLISFGTGEDAMLARGGGGGGSGGGTELEDVNPLDPGKYAVKAEDIVRTKKLGEGAFGFVYQGKWRDTDVAIKEVKGVSMDARRQIFDEAKRMLQLRNHPNVVSLIGICPNPFCIVIEFCAGGALDEKLYGKHSVRLDNDVVKRIVIGVARGISHLHAESIVHRDIAARNVLLTGDFTPKISDFGMSRVSTEGERQTTKTTVGPIKWMAPEQLSEQAVGPAADVWSYGVVLYEIYARSEPWPKMNNIKVAQEVMGGGSLEAPVSAPTVVANVMRRECRCAQHVVCGVKGVLCVMSGMVV